jgi:V8-like Glu-specific endopeptidase
MASDPQPGDIYAIQKGDSLLDTASLAYGVKEGSPERTRLAQKINAHPLNRRFWRTSSAGFERKHFPEGIISFGLNFTRDDPQRRAEKGEARSYARIFIPPREDLVHLRLGPATALPPNTALQEQADPDPCGFLDERWQTVVEPTDVSIAGADDRLPVANPLADVPNRWICSIFDCVLDPEGRTWQVVGAATGVRIGPNHVLTAAHVLYDQAATGSKVVVVSMVAAGLVFGRNGRLAPGLPANVPAPPALSSYGACLVTDPGSFWVPDEWKTRVDQAQTMDISAGMSTYDYGLIRFDPNRRCSLVGALSPAPRYWADAGSTGLSSTAAFWDYIQTGHTLHTAGYPGDKNFTQWKTSGILRDFGSVDGGYTNETPNNAWLQFDCDTVKGMSGSPVWLHVPKSRRAPERKVLAGVLSGALKDTPGSVYAAGLTPFVWNRLRAEMARK